ncbi:daptide biosynthesis intramembrane metalloprotease [Microbacterium maritypicum]|uniref:daptide biosynthesis intramembrane metalloprotease n=1 Tax=Microbacterium maritypicum TaxID=33918 RepID=UPI003558B4BF
MFPTSSLRRRKSSAPAPLTADTCPLLSTGVTFVGVGDESTGIAVLHGVPSSRVSRPVVDLLSAMDGTTSLHDLHLRFAASESSESFLQLVQRFRATGLLEGDTKLPPGRLTYRPPFTLQIATLRAAAIFGRLHRLIAPLPRRAILVSVAAVLSLGFMAAILQARELLNVVTTPMPLGAIVVLVAVLACLTLLHESAHGLTLTRYGGRSRRAGVMLFYLAPAFFVDVTDGWRLPRRRQRVEVALAGPAVHAVVAAIALTAALVAPQPVVRETLQILGLSCTAIVLVNLIPFVRFDGYIALMSALDEPNLRNRTIRDGANFLTGLLFGGRRMSKSVNTWWSVPFGLASLIAPITLVLLAVTRAVRSLAAGGPSLGMFVVALEAVVVLVGMGLLWRALHRVLRSGVSRLRFISVCAALGAIIVIAGAVIPVPMTATFGFSTEGGRVVLVHADGQTAVEVRDGTPIVLLSSGILGSRQVGEGTARPQRPEPTRVPLDALVPATAAGVSVSAVSFAEVDVSDRGGSPPEAGQARFDLGMVSLWEFLWATGVMQPLSASQNEK